MYQFEYKAISETFKKGGYVRIYGADFPFRWANKGGRRTLDNYMVKELRELILSVADRWGDNAWNEIYTADDITFISNLDNTLCYFECDANEGDESDRKVIGALRGWVDKAKKYLSSAYLATASEKETIIGLNEYHCIELLWDWLKSHKGKDYTITDDDRAFAAKYERMIDDYDKMSDKAKAIYRIDANKVKELLKGIRSKIYWFGKNHGTTPKKDISSLISDFSPNS